jgi:flagellar motor switch protein FliG
MANSSLYHAAIILKSLPKAQAAKILSRLEAVDIKTVFAALDKVGKASVKELQESLDNLESHMSTAFPPLTVDANGVFVDPLSSEVDSRKASDSIHQPFEFLNRVSAATRRQLLEDEHPKCIALVVAQLHPQIAAEVLHDLEPIQRISVLRRLCEQRESAPEEVAQLGYALKLRLNKIQSQVAAGSSGIHLAADLLSIADARTQQEVLDYMNQQDPDLAKQLQCSVFVFSDIVKLSDEEIKTLLKSADTSLWAPALKHCSLSTRRKILDNMAERAAQLLSQEIANIGPVDQHIAQRAQQQIVNIIVRLRRSGSIASNHPVVVAPSPPVASATSSTTKL